MKVVILCGGKGVRLGEVTQTIPKPMVSIGERPILWHIMNIYASKGYKDFILALGYKSKIIKKFFLDQANIKNNVENKLTEDILELKNLFGNGWNITLFETGINTMTGGRIKRLKKYLNKETFMLTYGDGLADIDIAKLNEFHFNHGKMVTITAVHPIARFGELNISNNQVLNFKEKPQTTKGWINGGFFIIDSRFMDLIDNDETILESYPLEEVARRGELMAYRHEAFWYCMDTVRDKDELELMWREERAPWKY